MKNLSKKSVLIASIFGALPIATLLAEDPPYSFTRGFPADEATIKKAQDATDLRRAIEATNSSSRLLRPKR